MGKMRAHAQSFPAWQALHPKQPCIHQHVTSQAPLVHSVCSYFGFQVKKKIYSHCCNCFETSAKFYRGFTAKDG